MLKVESKLGKVVNFAILRKFRRIKFSLFKRFLFRGQISRGGVRSC